MATKRAKNKIKIGDSVRVSRAWLKWELDNMNNNMLRPGKTEHDSDTYLYINFYTFYHLLDMQPVGLVVDYGAEDYMCKERLNLRVSFTHLGQSLTEILNEDDVKKIRR